jgi:hypothetical protein
MRVCESLHELIQIPLTDTLNVKNGLNYAIFLEALIRIAYYKLDDSRFISQDNGYKIILD